MSFRTKLRCDVLNDRKKRSTKNTYNSKLAYGKQKHLG